MTRARVSALRRPALSLAARRRDDAQRHATACLRACSRVPAVQREPSRDGGEAASGVSNGLVRPEAIAYRRQIPSKALLLLCTFFVTSSYSSGRPDFSLGQSQALYLAAAASCPCVRSASASFRRRVRPLPLCRALIEPMQPGDTIRARIAPAAALFTQHNAEAAAKKEPPRPVMATTLTGPPLPPQNARLRNVRRTDAARAAAARHGGRSEAQGGAWRGRRAEKRRRAASRPPKPLGAKFQTAD